MKPFFTVVLLFAFLFVSFAQEQRALVIGIDSYAPPEGEVVANDGGRIDFQNLEGCKNDALSIKQLLTRYNFTEQNITEIYNRDATRNNILKEIRMLLDNSKRGDIAFFYYAGHGSQIRNTKSKEMDQRDETIVPSDTWKAGVADIRDKELAKMFNDFIDKGVKLTVVFDCCHSGSLSRGAPNYSSLKPRYIAESNFDVKDESNPAPPELRLNSDFLIMSAAQDNEYAQEQYDNNDKPHGAFTIALLSAIQQLPIDIPVANLFQTIREILKVNGKRQEPVLAGTAERKKQNLFGVSGNKLSDELLVSVTPMSNGNIKVKGGFAFGLQTDNELIKINDTSVKIKIINVNSIGESEARIIAGNISQIETGSLFKISNWVSNTGPLLKVYLPTAVAYKDALIFAAVSAEIRKSEKLQWVNKIDEVDPDVSIYYVNNKWVSDSKKNGVKPLNGFSAKSIYDVAAGKKLYIELPPTHEVSNSLKQSFKSYRNLKIVPDASQANYIVYGTIDSQNNPAYGLKRAEVFIKDSLESLPLITRSVTLTDNAESANNNIADSLFNFSLKLAKLRGWLTISAPKKASFFPYHLELRDKKTNKKIIDSIGDKVGDNLSLHLVASANYLSKPIPQKYIYVFSLDKSGTMTLLFPDAADGNQGNKFPVRDNAGTYPKEFEIIEELQIVEPVGTDSYFVLATETPLDNYAFLFQQEGVRGGEKSSGNPLEEVMKMGNPSARAATPITPANWNLVRLSVKTRH